MDGTVITEDNHSDVVSLQVEGHSLDARVEADELSGLDTLEAIDTGNTVSHGQDASEMDDRGLVGLLPLLDSRTALEAGVVRTVSESHDIPSGE